MGSGMEKPLKPQDLGAASFREKTSLLPLQEMMQLKKLTLGGGNRG
jgi:hypothetical protein